MADVDYEALMQQGQGAPDAPPAADDDIYTTLMKQDRAAQVRDATLTTLGNSDANPDQAGRALALAPKVGAPASVVEANLPSFEQQVEVAKNRALFKENPVLAQWVAANPQAARAARDDFENMDFLTKIVTAAKAGFAGAVNTNELGREYNAKQIGELTGADNSRADARIADLEGQMKAAPQAFGGYAVLEHGVNFVTGLLDNFLHAQEYGAAGAVGGAALGAATTAPAAGVGAIPGAVSGYTAGTAFGFIADMARVQAGQTYRQIGLLKDEAGNPISEGARQIASVLSGLATYAVVGKLGGVVAGAGQKAVAAFMGDAVAEAVTKPTVAAMLGKAGTSLASGAGAGFTIMGAMEAANIVSEEFAKQIAPGNFATVFNDPLVRQQALERFGTAAVIGALTIGALHVPAAGAGVIADSIRVRQAARDAEFFQNLNDGAAASKLRTRAGDVFQDWIARQTDGTPLENLFIPAARVDELYQSMRIEPGSDGDPLFGFVPDIKQQLDQARAVGGDIVVKTADYATRLAGTDVHNAIKDDVRVRWDGMSVNEAKEYMRQRDQLLQDHAVSEAAKAEHEAVAQAPARAVFDDIFSKLRQAGQTLEVARQNAALMAARYAARAERLEGKAGTAFDLYKGENIAVQRVLPPTLRGVKVDQTDVLIEALRSGKMPSDRQLFGPSLLEYISQRGGMVDQSGELAAMDADKWHVGKPGMKRLVLPEATDEGPALIPKGKGEEGDRSHLTLDETALAAWEDKFFPEHEDRPTINDLLEAVRDELAGNKRYMTDNTTDPRLGFREAVADLERTLDELGIDVKTAKNEDIKAAIKAAFSEEGARAGDLEQGAPKEGGEARGSIRFEDGRTLISLFKDANLSTFLHESGHLFLDELVRDASDPTAPLQLQRDLRTVLDWMKVGDAENIGRDQHEMFARAFEAYLLEGRAPSAGLRSVFQRFRDWLVGIYKTVAALNTPINDEIRGVMDRLVATDREIEAARAQERLNPIFPDAKSAGMTDAEFQAYTKAVNTATEAARDKLLDKVMEDIRRRRTKEWQAEEQGIRDEVDRQVRSRPDLQALYFLRTGKRLDDPESGKQDTWQRLDRQALVDLYGSDAVLKLMPKGTFGKNGIDPGMIAEMFGLHSGDELVSKLMSLEAQRQDLMAQSGKKSMIFAQHLRELVEQEVERRMTERHGDMLNDGSIHDEAMAAIHSDQMAQVMAIELRALARQMGHEGPIDMGIMKRWAEDQIGKTPAGRISAGTFSRLEATAGRDVEKALVKGDLVEAFKAKQRQMLNHLMAKAAKEAETEVEKASKLFANLARRKSIATMDQAYLNRIHDLLERFGQSTRRNPAELAKQLGTDTLGDFVAAKWAEGREIPVPDFLMSDRSSQPFESLPMQDLRALVDTIKSLAANGRDEKTIEVQGKKLQMDLVVQEALAQVEGKKKLPVSNEAVKGELRRGLKGKALSARDVARAVDATLTKPEEMFNDLDGDDINGVFNRVVLQRLKAAQVKSNDLQQTAAKMIGEIRGKMPKGWSKDLDKRVPDIAGLTNPETGQPMEFTRKSLLTMALNIGSESNFDKLARGYGWDRQAVMDGLNKHLTKADWDFVQGIWDTFDHFWPDIAAMERRLSGVAPDKVEAMPVATPHGDYRGGYYPVIFDPNKSEAAAMHRGQSGIEMFENAYTRATTAKGHTISRTNAAYPISLDMNNIFWKIGQHLHDLAYREAVIDTSKFLRREEVSKLVREHLGSEYRDQMLQWVQSIANSRNIDDRGLSWWDGAMRGLRMRTVMVGIGFRISTMLKHGSTALVNSIGEVGAKDFAAASAEFLGSPQKMARMRDYVFERSDEMRQRSNQIDRDIGDALQKLQGESTAVATIQRMGHHGVAALDMASAMPTWLAAYRKAQREGYSEEEAIQLGDRSVRRAHGAQGITDMAAIQRGTELHKLLTMFYGFFNHIYNRERRTFKIAGEGLDKFRDGDYAGARRDFVSVLSRSFFYLIMPALIEGYVAEGGPNHDEKESWWHWAGKAILGEIPAGIPVARDAAKAFFSGHAYEFSPVGQVIKSLVTSAKDASRFVGDDKPVSDKWIKHTIESAGYVYGLPLGQAGGTLQYLWDIHKGRERPHDTTEFMRGLMFGNPTPHKKH